MSANHVYDMTVKMFGPQAEPAFESPSEQQATWGRQWGCDNDVGQLRTVMMHRPGPEFSIIDKTKRLEGIGSFGDLHQGWYFQSNRIPELAEMQAHHDALARVLRDEGVEVIMVEGVSGNRFKSCYTRDSSFAIKGGAVVCRLAAKMRRGEELPITRTLAGLGMPILRTIHGTGLMEGGSFAWINSRNAVVGRSIRVNDEGIAQVAEVLTRQGVELSIADLSGYSIHIDGAFLMVDVDLALINPSGLPYSFIQKLQALKVRTIEIGPDDDGWIVNGLAVRPGCVIMPHGMSERTREELHRNKVEIIELPYDNMHPNGGGIHCSTCPLVRDSID